LAGFELIIEGISFIRLLGFLDVQCHIKTGLLHPSIARPPVSICYDIEEKRIELHGAAGTRSTRET
jgi:hypothetical protein